MPARRRRTRVMTVRDRRQLPLAMGFPATAMNGATSESATSDRSRFRLVPSRSTNARRSPCACARWPDWARAARVRGTRARPPPPTRAPRRTRGTRGPNRHPPRDDPAPCRGEGRRAQRASCRRRPSPREAPRVRPARVRGVSPATAQAGATPRTAPLRRPGGAASPPGPRAPHDDAGHLPERATPGLTRSRRERVTSRRPTPSRCEGMRCYVNGVELVVDGGMTAI
jgi:hypothetical protein